MAEEHVQTLEEARDQLIGLRRSLAQKLATGQATVENIDLFVKVQDTMEAVENGIDHEQNLAAATEAELSLKWNEAPSQHYAIQNDGLRRGGSRMALPEDRDQAQVIVVLFHDLRAFVGDPDNGIAGLAVRLLIDCSKHLVQPRRRRWCRTPKDSKSSFMTP